MFGKRLPTVSLAVFVSEDGTITDNALNLSGIRFASPTPCRRTFVLGLASETDDEATVLISLGTREFASRLVELAANQVCVHSFTVEFEEQGTHWVEARCRGKLLTKVPFTLR